MAEFKKLESATENPAVKYCELLGYNAIKINKRSWPDRLIMLDNGYGFYVEFKREGKGPRKFQRHTHTQLRNKGAHVYAQVDSLEWFKKIIAHETNGLEWAKYNGHMTKFSEYVQ